MSDTPRTDAIDKSINLTMTPYPAAYSEMTDHARLLERDLTAARQQIEELRRCIDKRDSMFSEILAGNGVALDFRTCVNGKVFAIKTLLPNVFDAKFVKSLVEQEIKRAYAAIDSAIEKERE